MPEAKTLHTQRLRIEPLEASHASALFEGLRHEGLYEFIGEGPPESIEALEARYRRLSTRRSPDGLEAWLNWALWLPSAARHVGWLQATFTPIAPRTSPTFCFARTGVVAMRARRWPG